MVHLVQFWLKEEFKTAEICEKFEKSLQDLCKVDLSKQSSWGVPAAVEKRPVVDLSWDYNLVTEFSTVEDHDKYQSHPEHLKFLEENKGYWEKVLVIDSEIKFSV